MKKIYLLVLLSIALSPAFSQRFMRGVGTGVFVEKARGSDVMATAILTYSPRVNITESDFTSISVGVPLTVGFGGSYSSSYGEEYNDLNFMVNLPLIVNLNLGAGSTKDNEDRVGFFVGAGFGYHYGTQSTYDSYYGQSYSSSASTYGPGGNIGFRFAVGSHQKNIEARLSYMKGMKESYKTDIYGLAALFNF